MYVVKNLNFAVQQRIIQLLLCSTHYINHMTMSLRLIGYALATTVVIMGWQGFIEHVFQLSEYLKKRRGHWMLE